MTAGDNVDEAMTFAPHPEREGACVRHEAEVNGTAVERHNHPMVQLPFWACGCLQGAERGSNETEGRIDSHHNKCIHYHHLRVGACWGHGVEEPNDNKRHIDLHHTGTMHARQNGELNKKLNSAF